MRIHIYAKDVPNRHKRDISYPVGHLSLLSPETDFETCDISTRQNRASINAFLICLLPSACDVRHPLGAGSRCKGTTKFSDVQIKIANVLIIRDFLFIGCHKAPTV